MGQHKKCRSYIVPGSRQHEVDVSFFRSESAGNQPAPVSQQSETSNGCVPCSTSSDQGVRDLSALYSTLLSHAYTASVRVIPPVAETIGSPAVGRPFCRPEPGGGCARFTVVRSDNNLATCRQTYIRVSYSPTVPPHSPRLPVMEPISCHCLSHFCGVVWCSVV